MADNKVESKNGVFEISTPAKTHQGSVSYRDGCTSIDFGSQTPDEPTVRGAFDGDFHYDIGSGSVKKLSATVFQAETPTSQIGSLLNNVTDFGGRRIGDLSKVRANPDQYLVEIGDTQTTVESAIRAGFLQIDGNGQFQESLKAQFAAIHPESAANERLVAAVRQAKENAPLPRDGASTAVHQILATVGIQNPDAMSALAYTDEKAALAKLTQTIGDAEKAREVYEVAAGNAEFQLSKVAKMSGGGDAMVAHLQKLNPGLRSSIVQGVLAGNKPSIEKWFALFKRGDTN